VRTVVDEVEIVGDHTATWDGRNYRGAEVSSGVYFVRFEVGRTVRTTKIVLLK
jgi:flagellar hook assembly protein FlgD